MINKQKCTAIKNIRWVVGGYLLIILIFGLTVKTTLEHFEQVNQNFRNVVETNNVKSQYMLEMRDAIRERILLLHSAIQLNDVFDIDDKVQAYNEMARKFIIARDQLNLMQLSDKQKSQLKHQREALAQAQPLLDDVIISISISNEVFTGKEERQKIYDKMQLAQSMNKKVTNELEMMRILQQQLAQQSVKNSHLSMSKAKQQIFIFFALLALLSSIVLWIVVAVVKKQNKVVNDLLNQLNLTNAGLEEEVFKRSAELLKSREDNVRMGTELAITSKIQQMLLPLDNELATIPDLQIAASMKPAEEAGGDYYDVLRYHDKTIIGIGDVTGHGLESSIVMLMAQSTVRTLAVSNISDPIQFLHFLNQTIFDNLSRIKSYKNLSLMLAYYADNKLTICGQHEDMLLVHKDSQLVTRIDTVDFGFPIGLERDIEDFLHPEQFDIYSGDIVVLYTDGIPEAENTQGEFYGLDRLCKQILKNIHLPVQKIHDNILSDLYQFIGQQEVYDDVTLMIIKKT